MHVADADLGGRGQAPHARANLVTESEGAAVEPVGGGDPVDHLHRRRRPDVNATHGNGNRDDPDADLDRHAERARDKDRLNDRSIQSGEALHRQVLGVLEELVTGDQIERLRAAHIRAGAEEVPDPGGLDAPRLGGRRDERAADAEQAVRHDEAGRRTVGVDERAGQERDPHRVEAGRRGGRVQKVNALLLSVEPRHKGAEAAVGVAEEAGR